MSITQGSILSPLLYIKIRLIIALNSGGTMFPKLCCFFKQIILEFSLKYSFHRCIQQDYLNKNQVAVSNALIFGRTSLVMARARLNYDTTRSLSEHYY